ncbi:MAG: phenylacetate-CoA oxygenase subunit PaaJ [Bacteroidetes bacterium]|nr:MAG: phenylacetate-CoA oxygenase subunit PaaJ [Bacteroidota bacterium]
MTIDITTEQDVTARVWQLLHSVPDPEVPVLSVIDLGIVRGVEAKGSHGVVVTITPTYSGCPAMDMIAMNIKMAVLAAGLAQVEIKTVLSPAWTTDWMTPAGKEKLLAYGIAPPVGRALDEPYLEDLQPACPQCGSTITELVSQFGSTACKALFVCRACGEPFDYFKCH